MSTKKNQEKRKPVETTGDLKFVPENDEQNKALNNLKSDASFHIFAGSAGTGKTLLATTFAIKEFVAKKYQKIVITRPAVTVEEDLGFLPGDLTEKLHPWMLPILDIFSEFFEAETIEYMIKEKIIEIAPIGYMRGRTLGPIILNDNSDQRGHIIIADEMQNSTPQQAKMLATRLGENSKMIFTGDPTQHDRGSEENGLNDLIKRYRVTMESNKPLKNITLDYFTKKNVVRSKAVKELLTMYPEDK